MRNITSFLSKTGIEQSFSQLRCLVGSISQSKIMQSAKSSFALAAISFVFPVPMPYAGVGSMRLRTIIPAVTIPSVFTRPSSSSGFASGLEPLPLLGAPIKSALAFFSSSC